MVFSSGDVNAAIITLGFIAASVFVYLDIDVIDVKAHLTKWFFALPAMKNPPRYASFLSCEGDVNRSPVTKADCNKSSNTKTSFVCALF